MGRNPLRAHSHAQATYDVYRYGPETHHTWQQTADEVPPIKRTI
jgi:hypothetical protein